MKRILATLAVLATLLGAAVVVAQPASANSYPGLHQVQFENNSLDILRMRVSLEDDGAGHWRGRLHAICLKDTSHGQISQTCAWISNTMSVYESFGNLLGTKSWYDVSTGDIIHVGTYRTPSVGHFYSAVMTTQVQFADGITSQFHTDCTYYETYLGHDTWSQGSLSC